MVQVQIRYLNMQREMLARSESSSQVSLVVGSVSSTLIGLLGPIFSKFSKDAKKNNNSDYVMKVEGCLSVCAREHTHTCTCAGLLVCHCGQLPALCHIPAKSALTERRWRRARRSPALQPSVSVEPAEPALLMIPLSIPHLRIF